MINKKSKIYIAGHKGMVGSSLVRLFQKKGYTKILTRTKKQLDLLDQSKTYAFLKKQKPDAVIIAAARVGGIHANNEYRADFIYQNLQIQNNLIHGSYLAGVKKLIFLGSSCIYPRDCKQPIKEEYLLTGPLEQTNEPYAIAKIAGLKMIENYNRQYKTNYLCLMPCNLYGPNDNYDLNNSHFLPALIRKIHEAKVSNKNKVELWGDGSPKRELMHVDDLANSCLYFLKNNTSNYMLNIGSGEEHSIKVFANKISKIIGYDGNIVFNKRFPNGTPRKVLDTSLANNLGWKSKILFDQEIRSIYDDFQTNQ
jgi:GDP-L-fucose synthase